MFQGPSIFDIYSSHVHLGVFSRCWGFVLQLQAGFCTQVTEKDVDKALEKLSKAMETVPWHVPMEGPSAVLPVSPFLSPVRNCE